jgi:hypothetical protein
MPSESASGRRTSISSDAGGDQRVAQRGLGGLDPRQPLGGDRDAVGDPAGQARGGRLVGQCEAPLSGRGADVGLGQPGVGQRRPGAALGGGPDAGPEAGAQIVGVGAGGDVGDAQRVRERPQDLDQLGLAEGAAVAGVGDVAGPRQLVGARGLVPDAERGHELRGARALAPGQARRDRGGGDDPVRAEGPDGGGEQHPRVDAAGERHEQARQWGEQAVEGCQPVVEGHGPEGATAGAGKPTATRATAPVSSTRATSRPSGATAATSPAVPVAGIRWP